MTKKELRESLMDHQLAFLLHGGQVERIPAKKLKENRVVTGKQKRVFV